MSLINQIQTFLKQRKQKTFEAYTAILIDNFPYFNTLSTTDQSKFLNRVHNYRKSKTFTLVGLEDNPAIEVLISAAAVQLTFGMNEYRMTFFKKIYVTKDAYTYGESTVPWAGHVNRNGIHISWNHFMHGYQYNNDKYNVGLHEMAHALEYEFQYGSYSNDEHLVLTFQGVMRQIDGVFFHEGWKPAKVFTEEGLQNKHEAWAESIELFFENPAELNRYYPDLFDGIKRLINQDPFKLGSPQP